MALIERLTGAERELKIHVLAFVAALGEWARGRATRTDIVQAFGLRPVDEVDLDLIVGLVTSMPVEERFKFRTELLDILLLAEDGTGYQSATAVRNRLGI